ncbi:MAG: PDZ domain-containing protein [Bacillota bacterium]
MHDILRIAGLVLKEISSLVTNEFFWLIFILLILMYRKSSAIEKLMLGNKYPMLEKISGSLVGGIIGGLLGSFLVISLGITLQDYAHDSQNVLASGIMYIWLVAILLSMINTRYLCFSYAGGIVAVSNLLTGFPIINVPGLLALIGILHLVESLLIRLDGYTYSIPLFLKKGDGSIVGGYMMNKMWPIPLVMLVFGISVLSSPNVIGIQSMPDWWPIMNQAVPYKTGVGVLPFLVPVVLGYGDVAITRTAEQRCKDSSWRLAVYSVILIVLSVAATIHTFFAYAAAIFAPVAHEMLILYGKMEEENGKPLFASSYNGVTVLYTRKNSPASDMRLEPGDIILSINNTPVDSEVKLAEFLSERPSVVWLEIKKASGIIETREYQDYGNGINGLGALIVPKNVSMYFELNETIRPYQRLINYIKRKLR